MATSNPALKTSSTAENSKEITRTILPYIIGMLVQIPLLVLYFFWLGERPHYSSWFPFGILATVVLIYFRWPRDGKQVFMESLWSNILLAIAIISGLLAVLFVEPWFAACSVYTLIASLMARVIDRETGRSLWPVALPLYVTLAIPLNYDQRLINWLQSSSAHLTSRLLDLVNIAHYMPGTVIEVPGNKYGIEEACSGIQSFFLLLFVAVVLCVWLRRTVFRSILLIAAAVIWSVFMNCIRIFLIPIFDINFDIDLSVGIQHDLLGWSTMAMGVMLLLSTDQFLMFLFGPVDPGTGSSGPLGKFITKVWNGLIAGKKDDEETTKRRKSRRKPLTSISKLLAWATAVLLGVGGLWALMDIKNCYEAPEHASLNFFSTKVVYPLKETSLPAELDGWRQIKNGYKSDDRSRGSDFGEKSDSWTFLSPTGRGFLALASFDQAFPGWHELTTCYKNSGWELIVRKKQEYELPGADGESTSWPYIEAHFEKATGERGMLVFSLFDGFGEPFDPPKEWNAFAHLMHGATGRLGSRIRARLFQNSAYQTQIFVRGYGEIDAKIQDEVTDRYLKIREIMRQEFIAARQAEENGGASSAVALNQ